MPHLSLMYGKFPVALKKIIVNKIDGKFGAFVAKDIYLMRIGSPEQKDWHIVKKFRLK